MTPAANRRIVLAARPHGRLAASDFRLETTPVPAPAEGQVLLRTQLLSLDPYMRHLMDEPGPGYAPPLALGATMPAAPSAASSRRATRAIASATSCSPTPAGRSARCPTAPACCRRATRRGRRSGSAAWALDVGLERAPEALAGLLEGRHLGKVVVRVAD
jgi:NADPH-dependent curcumin reductase CurA